MPHLLRHGLTVYNGHLRGPVTLTPVAERLAVELSLPVATGDRTPISRMRGERSTSTPPWRSIELSSKVGNMYNNSKDHANQEPSVFPVSS